MKRTFEEALRHRRSHYALAPDSPVADDRIIQIVKFVMEVTPSAFNSHSARLVVLLHEYHKALWQIVVETLRPMVGAEQMERTRKKIEQSFAAGYGTVLFFEDQNVVKDLQRQFPTYADKFEGWSAESSAMHQLALWTALEEEGFGASLQHYNPLIDNAVRDRWQLPSSWRLIAQMPFGTPLDEPAPREMQPMKGRMKIFG